MRPSRSAAGALLYACDLVPANRVGNGQLHVFFVYAAAFVRGSGFLFPKLRFRTEKL